MSHQEVCSPISTLTLNFLLFENVALFCKDWLSRHSLPVNLWVSVRCPGQRVGSGVCGGHFVICPDLAGWRLFTRGGFWKGSLCVPLPLRVPC